MLIHYKALSLYAAAAAAASGLLAVTPAHAQDDSLIVTAQRVTGMPWQRVSYRDLDLTLAPHRVTLIRRVDHAVTRVCLATGHNIDKTLESRMSHHECSVLAWNGARPQLAAAINRAWAARG